MCTSVPDCMVSHPITQDGDPDIFFVIGCARTHRDIMNINHHPVIKLHKDTHRDNMNINHQSVIKLCENTRRHIMNINHQLVIKLCEDTHRDIMNINHKPVIKLCEDTHRDIMNINHQLVIKLCEETYTHIMNIHHQPVKLCEDTHKHHEHKPCSRKYHLYSGFNWRQKHCMKIINYLWLAHIVPLATLLIKWGDTLCQ
jgi:hypothetical protein